jgi:hypothetical protein
VLSVRVFSILLGVCRSAMENAKSKPSTRDTPSISIKVSLTNAADIILTNLPGLEFHFSCPRTSPPGLGTLSSAPEFHQHF